MLEFTIPLARLNRATPFYPYARHYVTSPRRDRSNCDIGFFRSQLFFLSFFQLIAASRLLAPRARGFLSVIFPPPGNYVGAADQTREEVDVARKKKSLCIFKSRLWNERGKAVVKREERVREGDGEMKKGAFSEPSYPYDDEARWRTARARAPRQWVVFAHPKIGRRKKNGNCLRVRQKLLREKKQ